MHVTRDAQLSLRADVPPGESLVGVQVAELFRVLRLRTTAQPTLKIAVDGGYVPCDGEVHEVGSLERTLRIGELAVLHVINEGDHPATLDLVLVGMSLGRTVVTPFRTLVGPVLPEPPPEAA